MKEKKYCSFCGKTEDKVKRLISGQNGACICDECIEICGDMVRDLDAESLQPVPLKKPAEIKEELDKYIVGQNEAKKVLSVAVYNHYKRINNMAEAKQDDGEVEIEKSNILVLYFNHTASSSAVMICASSIVRSYTFIRFSAYLTAKPSRMQMTQYVRAAQM